MRRRWFEWPGAGSRVSRRLLQWVLLFGAAGTLAVSAWDAQSDNRMRRDHLARDLQATAEFVAPLLARSLWTFDAEQVRNQLDAFGRLSQVSGLSLEVPGQPLLRRGDAQATDDAIAFTVPLVHVEDGRRHELGRLTLVNDLRAVQAEQRSRARASLLGNGIVILLTALGSVLIYQMVVTRRLLAVAGQLRGVTAQDLRLLPEPSAAAAAGARGDELDELTDSVAALRETGRRALAAADEEHARLRGLMNALPDLVWLKDTDGRYLACNRRFEAFFGAPEADIRGRDDYAFVARELADSFRENDRRALEADGPRTNEEWLTFASDGHRGLFETTKVPMRRADGRVIGVLGVARDITAQHDALRALRDREELYRSIVDQAGDGIVLNDPEDGRFIEFNDAACRQLGYSREEMAELTLFDVQVDTSPEVVVETLQRIGLVGQGRFERRHRRKDGSVRDGWISAAAVSLHGRSLVVSLWHDLTPFQEAQAAILAERELRESIIEAIPGVFYALDEQARLVFWNRNVERVSGFTGEQLQACTAADFIVPQDRARMERSMAEVFVDGSSEVEVEVLTDGGLVVPYFFKARRIDLAGRRLAVGSGIDISALREARRELQALNAELEQRVQQRTADLRHAHDQLADTQFAMDGVGIGISWVDAHSGRFIHCNRFTAEFLGYSHDELLRLSVWDIDPNFPPQAFVEVVAGLREEGFRQFETTQRSRDGALRPVEMTIYYDAGREGVAPRLIAFMTDIARRKDAEAALLRAKDEAEAASRAKSTFLANMSHEIRTPMNAIIGLTHLLRREPLAPPQLDKLVKIDSSCRHLLAIINDILDLAKIESGHMELHDADFHLSAVLDSVASIIREPAQDKGLALHVDAAGVPMWLRGDATRLRQALLNYAGNAVKFTDAGSVTLRAERLAAPDPDEVRVLFEVTDTGGGIEADKMDRLFQEFEQTDSSTTRRHGGTGLGLAITQRLAGLMGGEVGASSTPGAGSRFWFTARLRHGRGIMPAEPAALAVAADEPWQQLQGLHARLLLVEDNAINREVAMQLLHGSALQVDTADNGSQAVTMARAQHYDLVLMDVQMPVMDGKQATRLLRLLPGWSRTPIVAMTANAFDDDRRACALAGMDDFIAKPVEAGVLYATLLRWLRDAPPAAVAAPVASGPAPATGPEQTEATLRRLAARPGMDLTRGLVAFAGKPARYVELLGKLASSQREALAGMRQALADGRPEDARFMAHTLKGAAASLGAAALSEHAAGLDRLLRGGDAAQPATAAVHLDAIEAALDMLDATLGPPPAGVA